MPETKKRRKKRLTIHYPEVLEEALRKLAADSGVPLSRLKESADAHVRFPSAKGTWLAYRDRVETQAGLFDDSGDSILLAEEDEDPQELDELDRDLAADADEKGLL